MSFDEKLIEMVRSYEVLYDLSNPKYMDVDHKNQIWDKIAKELKSSGPTCKTRWSNIRDNFRKSLRKRKTVSGQKAKIVKPYKFSQQLSFLVGFLEERETKSNLEDDVSETSTQLAEPAVIIQDEEIPSDSNEVDDPTPLEPQQNASSNLKSPVHTQLTLPRKKAKRFVPNVPPPKTAAATVMEYLVKKNEAPSTSQHPVDAFLSGIAPSLKNLSPQHWYYAKGEIFETVQKYEYKMLLEKQEISTTRFNDFSCNVGNYEYNQSSSSTSLA